MFSYYGSKSKIVKYYPAANFDTIIEPFAGSARYSLYNENYKKKVILNEKDKVIAEIWNYLITTTKERILSLPDLKKGDKISNFDNLSNAEKYLIGFCINRGSNKPKLTASNFNDWDKDKIRIANMIDKIKHFKIIYGDYKDLDNIEATWFIDPPYQFGGALYRENKIDYNFLANWCKTRKGQIIVCENDKANWLNFKPLHYLQGQRHKTLEVIFTNYKELTLFD